MPYTLLTQSCFCWRQRRILLFIQYCSTVVSQQFRKGLLLDVHQSLPGIKTPQKRGGRGEITTSASVNSIVCVEVVWIYFLETHSDSQLFTCCEEPVPWPPEAESHQPSIHHLPPAVSPPPLGPPLLIQQTTTVHTAPVMQQHADVPQKPLPPCARSHTCLLSHTDQLQNWSEPPVLKIATSSSICHHLQMVQLLHTNV